VTRLVGIPPRLCSNLLYYFCLDRGYSWPRWRGRKYKLCSRIRSDGQPRCELVSPHKRKGCDPQTKWSWSFVLPLLYWHIALYPFLFSISIVCHSDHRQSIAKNVTAPLSTVLLRKATRDHQLICS